MSSFWDKIAKKNCLIIRKRIEKSIGQLYAKVTSYWFDRTHCRKGTALLCCFSFDQETAKVALNILYFSGRMFVPVTKILKLNTIDREIQD